MDKKETEGWQPIETAPTNGEKILITNPDWSNTDAPEIARWKDCTDWNGGYWLTDGGTDYDEDSYSPPTLWHRIPKLPNKKG